MDLKNLAAQYGGKAIESVEPVETDASSLAAKFGGVPVTQEKPEVAPAPDAAALAAKFGGTPIAKETTIKAPPVEAKATAPVEQGRTVDFHKANLQEMGINTGVSSKEDVLNQLIGPLKTTNPAVNQKLYSEANKNYDFASSEAQKALRSGASQEQAADIFAQSLQQVAQLSSNGTMRYPDTTIQAVKNAITRGGLGFGRDIASIAALGAGAIGAGTTSRELLGQSQKLEDISSQYPGQFASTEEALAKGDTLEDKAKNLAMRALEGSIENAPSMLSSIGGASGARLLATKGIEAYAAKYGKKASEDLLEKASKWGVASGALATSIGLEAGSIYKDIYDKTGELHPGVATAFGTLAGALDAIVPIQEANTISTVARKEMIESLGKTIAQRYGVDALKSIGEEAATEFLQTFIEKGGVSFVNGDPVFNKANLNEALDAAFIGAAMGGGTHLTAQAIQDLLMKTQGMSREEAKEYYKSEQAATEARKKSEQAATEARKEALDKWKTKGLTQKQTPEAEVKAPVDTAAPPVVETPEQKKAALVKQFIDNGHTKDNANLLADQQIKEAENAGRTDSGTTGEGVQVPGGPAPVEPTGRTEQPIGAPVVGAGSTAGTTAQGTVQQSAPLTPTSGLVDLMHASGAEFKSPAQVKAFLNKVAPDEIAPLAEANPKIYKAILDEWKATPAPVQEAPAEEAKAEEVKEKTAPTELKPFKRSIFDNPAELEEFKRNLEEQRQQPQQTEQVQPEEVAQQEQAAPEEVKPKEVVKEQPVAEAVEEAVAEEEPHVAEAKHVAARLRAIEPYHPHLEALQSPAVTPADVEFGRQELDALKPKAVPKPIAPDEESASVNEVNTVAHDLLSPQQIKDNPPVVVNDYADLPVSDDIKQQAEQGGVKAFVDPSTNKAYYIASQIPKNEVKGTILHEHGGHIGLVRLIGAPRLARLATQVESWAKGGTALENVIAKEAIAMANISGEKPGTEQYQQEVVAYFTEIAVNRYGIDPLKTQPKSKQKVAVWLRELWDGVLSSLRKLNTDPSKLTAHDIVTLVHGAARVGTGSLEKTETKAALSPGVITYLLTELANNAPHVEDATKEPEPKIQASAKDLAIKLGVNKPGVLKTFIETYYDEIKHISKDPKEAIKEFLKQKGRDYP